MKWLYPSVAATRPIPATVRARMARGRAELPARIGSDLVHGGPAEEAVRTQRQREG